MRRGLMVVVLLTVSAGAAVVDVATAADISADRMIWTRYGAANVDGPPADATLIEPISMVGTGGGSFYVGDIGRNTIKRYNAATGRLNTVVAADGTFGFAGDGGPYAQARFNRPFALARTSGGAIIVSDFDNQRVRAFNPTARPVTVATISIAPGTIETIAGNGEITPECASPPEDVPARETSMCWPRGLAVDSAGNIFYCDVDNMRLRVVWNTGPKAGKVETVAGRGQPADFHEYSYPNNHGDGGPARSMMLTNPSAVTVAPDGDIYVAEWSFSRQIGDATGVVWRIDHEDQTAHRIAGNGVAKSGGDGGPGRKAGLHGNIQSLVLDGHGGLLIADNFAIRRLDLASSVISTFAGRDLEVIPTFDEADAGHAALGADMAAAAGVFVDKGETYYADPEMGVVRKVDAQGTLRDVILGGAIKQPMSVAFDSADRLFVTEWAHGRVRRLDPDGSLVTAVNGDDVYGADRSATALGAHTGASNGVAFDEHGDMFFTDTSGARVLQVRSDGGVIRPESPLREIGRWGRPSEGCGPPSCAIIDQIAASDGKVYVSDIVGGRIRVVDPATGSHHTLAGGDGTFDGPTGLVLDRAKGRLYVADTGHNRIAAVDVATGAVSAVADLPYQYPAPELHLALADDLLFVSNEGTDTVHVLDLTAAHPTPHLYAGAEASFLPFFGGDGGSARAALLEDLKGIAVDSTGRLTLVERSSARVRVVGTSDLKPGAFPNKIHSGSPDTVKLAIESNPLMDATRLVPGSIKIAGAATHGPQLQDVNGDGRDDLVVTIGQDNLANHLPADAREAAITGDFLSGRQFRDADWVTVVP